MNQFTVNNIVWGFVIGVIFLGAFELPAVFHLTPWGTLSTTVKMDDKRWPILALPIGSLLLGILVHWLDGVNFWKAWAIAAIVLVCSHVADGWPKW